MQKGTNEVKSKVDGSNVVVGTAEYWIFDQVEEAIDELGEAKCVQLINTQTRTDEMNKLRASSRPGGVSKKALRDKAINDLVTNNMQRLTDCAGDDAAIQAVIEARMEELKEEMLTTASAVQVETAAEEEDALEEV